MVFPLEIMFSVLLSSYPICSNDRPMYSGMEMDSCEALQYGSFKIQHLLWNCCLSEIHFAGKIANLASLVKKSYMRIGTSI